jgi:hypothetical protein
VLAGLSRQKAAGVDTVTNTLLRRVFENGHAASVEPRHLNQSVVAFPIIPSYPSDCGGASHVYVGSCRQGFNLDS